MSHEQFPQRIEDPEKARAMAEASNLGRSRAAGYRSATRYAMRKGDGNIMGDYIAEAVVLDRLAEKLEEEAALKYDSERIESSQIDK